MACVDKQRQGIALTFGGLAPGHVGFLAMATGWKVAGNRKPDGSRELLSEFTVVDILQATYYSTTIYFHYVLLSLGTAFKKQ